MKYGVLSLFSGSMGLDLGLAATGRFAHLACVERDPACCKTIQANRDAGRVYPGKLYEADIEKLDPRSVMADLGRGGSASWTSRPPRGSTGGRMHGRRVGPANNGRNNGARRV